MLAEIIAFIKNPLFQEDPNKETKYRIRFLVICTLFGITISIGLSLIAGLFESMFSLELGKHAMDELFEKYSAIGIFFFAVIVAPLLEELLFRGPIVWFKNSKYFKTIFYLIALFFGYIHITNFEISTTVLLLSPILVAPQISLGLLLGMIRIKFGLLWSMAMHAFYNFILASPLILIKLLDIPLEWKKPNSKNF